jgi:hypothetical protein
MVVGFLICVQSHRLAALSCCEIAILLIESGVNSEETRNIMGIASQQCGTSSTYETAIWGGDDTFLNFRCR